MRVTITNLRKSYGRAAAVDDLSLEIASGALFALVGPSVRFALPRQTPILIDPAALIKGRAQTRGRPPAEP